MIDKFFSPNSVAVIGASREPGKVGHDILKNIIDAAFEGQVSPVNPKAEEVLGLKCYKDVREIPGEVDLAVVVVPAAFVEDVAAACAEKSVKAMIVVSAGFKESGPEGAQRERELFEKIQASGIRVIGPNCLGVIDTGSKLNATFAQGMPQAGNIAFFSQSGALCTAILDLSLDQGIGFSKFVSLGNKMDVGEVDLLRALRDDASTDVVLGYIEGVKDGAGFIKAAEETGRMKPVVIAKSGGTAAGARAASSHTGTLAGSESAFRAAFIQSGLIRAESIEDLFDYALAFSYQGLPNGPKTALITNAGGPGIIAADAVERSNLQMASFGRDTIEALREALPPTANIYNPIDVIGDAKADRYRVALEKAISDDNVHAVIVILTPQAMTDVEEIAHVVAELAASSKQPVLTSFMGGPSVRDAVAVLRQAKVPNYTFPEKAVRALDAMWRYKRWRDAPAPAERSFSVKRAAVRKVFQNVLNAGRFDLGEMEAREVISAYGFEVPESILARNEEEASKAAEEIGFPVVMKIASPDILHKSDIGGVHVGISDPAEARTAFLEIRQNTRRHMPDAEIWGVLVQQMVGGGKEVILGMSKDPQFGPLLMFGLGGIYVEALKDVAFRIAPISVDDADAMIHEIRSFPLLRGVRGEKPADIAAIKNSLVRLSQLVTDFPEIIELDINPLMVFAEGLGATAIDARITLGR